MVIPTFCTQTEQVNQMSYLKRDLGQKVLFLFALYRNQRTSQTQLILLFHFHPKLFEGILQQL